MRKPRKPGQSPPRLPVREGQGGRGNIGTQIQPPGHANVQQIIKKSGAGAGKKKNYGTAVQPGGKLAPKKPGGPAGGAGGGRGANGDPMYGAYGSFPGVSVNEAKRSVASQIREGVRDYRKERRTARHEASTDRQQAKADYRRGLGDLEHIYGETSDFIGYQKQQMDQEFDANRDQAAASTSALLNVLQQGAAQTGGEATATMNQFGIGAGGDMGEFAADAANNTAVAQQTGANALTNINFAQTGADSISNIVAGMNQGQYQSSVGQNLNARNDRFAEIQQTKQDNYQEVREAIHELKNSRPDLVRQLLDQMQQSKWGQYMDMANLNLQRSAQRSQNRYYNTLSRRSSGGGGSGFTPYGSNGSNNGTSESGTQAGGGGNSLALDELLGTPGSGSPGSEPNGNRKRNRGKKKPPRSGGNGDAGGLGLTY